MSWWSSAKQEWLSEGLFRSVLEMTVQSFAPVGVWCRAPRLLMEPMEAGTVAHEVTQFFLRQLFRTLIKASFAEREDHFLFLPSAMVMSHGLMDLVQHWIHDGLHGGRGCSGFGAHHRMGAVIHILQ